MREPGYLENYRPNVGICLFNRHGKVWLGRRTGVSTSSNKDDTSYIWQMPQGGIDPGEDIATAAARELHEETGVKSARILTVSPGWLVYDFPESYRRKKQRKWRGQRQKWVAMIFEGKDREVDLDVDNQKEFDDWRWAKLHEAPKLIVPFKNGVYQEVVSAFTPLADYLRDTA